MNKTESAFDAKRIALLRAIIAGGNAGGNIILITEMLDEIERLQAEKETLSRELSVYMEAVTKLENAIDGL